MVCYLLLEEWSWEDSWEVWCKVLSKTDKPPWLNKVLIHHIINLEQQHNMLLPNLNPLEQQIWQKTNHKALNLKTLLPISKNQEPLLKVPNNREGIQLKVLVKMHSQSHQQEVVRLGKVEALKEEVVGDHLEVAEEASAVEEVSEEEDESWNFFKNKILFYKVYFWRQRIIFI